MLTREVFVIVDTVTVWARRVSTIPGGRDQLGACALVEGRFRRVCGPARPGVRAAARTTPKHFEFPQGPD